MKAQRRKILEYSLPRELNPGPKVGIYASQTFETSAINNFYLFYFSFEKDARRPSGFIKKDVKTDRKNKT